MKETQILIGCMIQNLLSFSRFGFPTNFLFLVFLMCCTSCARDADIRTIYDKNGGDISAPRGGNLSVRFDGTIKKLTDSDVEELSPALDRVGAVIISFGRGQNGVTDNSIPHLRKIHSLRRLIIVDTKVTARGLIALKGMPRLEFVAVSPSVGTAEEIAKLRSALSPISLYIDGQ